ncbi:MAG: PD-(D/E)XK nuclease family protein [Bacteroidales bacterium]|nr:PD-(D/E)XK nuclease family protein [Candidatus Liminaster caballi]
MNTNSIFQDYLGSGFHLIAMDRVGALSTLSMEQLITLYNGFVQEHAELEEYLAARNTFDVIGKARNEGVHSAFLKDLIAGNWFDEKKKENTAIHLLDIILTRAENQDKRNEINEELRKAILTRNITLDKAIGECELTIEKYLTKYGFNNQQLKDAANKDKRIDVYLRLELREKILGRDCIEVFIENKVQSKEHSCQTDIYYDECYNGGGKRPFQIFVYLSPLPLVRINRYNELDECEKPSCPHYVSICYQDILDTIIEPLRIGKYTSQEKAQLDDYVSCLELPAMPDGEDAASASLNIMATSRYERQLIGRFLENPVNKFIYEHALALQNGESLFRTTGEIHPKCIATPFLDLDKLNIRYKHHLLTDHDLICYVMKQRFLPLIKLEDEILRQIDDCKVVGHQNGSTPFLVWSPEPCQDNLFLHYFDTNLCEYRGKAYRKISNALDAAVSDYINEHDGFVDIVDMFAPVYARKGAVKPCFTTDCDDAKTYQPSKVESLYIRKEIEVDKLSVINDILGKDYEIKPLSTELFRELHACGVKNGCVLCPSADESVTFKSARTNEYIRIDGTDFYYRKAFDRANLINLNNMLALASIELVDDQNPDIQLLQMFIKSHQALIFSVKKISSELY